MDLLESLIYLIKNTNNIIYKGYDGEYEFLMIFNDIEIEIEVHPTFEDMCIRFKGDFNYEFLSFDDSQDGFKELIDTLRDKFHLENKKLSEEFIEDIEVFKRNNLIKHLS